jgi:hypothetical protein
VATEEYTGPKKRCDWCEHIFKKFEKIVVVGLGFVFCSSKYGIGKESGCIDRWQSEHKISEIEFHEMIFPGSKRKHPDDDSGDLALI